MPGIVAHVLNPRIWQKQRQQTEGRGVEGQGTEGKGEEGQAGVRGQRGRVQRVKGKRGKNRGRRIHPVIACFKPQLLIIQHACIHMRRVAVFLSCL